MKILAKKAKHAKATARASSNAQCFCTGSPIAGTRIAVTDGLLKTLDQGEVEAVIGHELGHLIQRDVQVMLFFSLLPSIAYYIGFSLMLSGVFGGNQKNQGSAAVTGIVFNAFSWTMNLFILYFSRLREYYADRHSASIVDNGSQKLSTGLAKTVKATKNMGKDETTRKRRAPYEQLQSTVHHRP